MKDDFTPRRHAALDIAHDIIDMQRELDGLRYEVCRLREIERKYDDLLMNSIRHNEQMLNGIFEIAMTPGVLDAIGRNNEGAPA